jgi:hypothetical protein
MSGISFRNRYAILSTTHVRTWPLTLYQYSRPFEALSRLWAVLSVLSLLLTISAIVYTFTVENHTGGQHIDLSVESLKTISAYPLDCWTPQTWFAAVLELGITNDNDRHGLESQLRLANGWKWNLIFMFLLQIAVTPLIMLEVMGARKGKNVNYAGL